MTPANDAHARLQDWSGVYTLDALEAAERLEFEAHLRACAACRDEVASLRPVADALMTAVPVLGAPRPAVRDRVLRAVATGAAAPPVSPGAAVPADVVRLDEVRARRAEVPTRTTVPWLTAAAAVLALAASGYAWTLRVQVAELAARLDAALVMADQRDRELVQVRTVAQQTQSTVSVLSASDLQRVELDGQRPLAPSAHGRAFWSRSRGGLVFTATNLPPPPDGKVYQLWFVTNVAVSAGLLQPDATGQVSMVAPTDPAMGAPVAMAVTLEPAGGVPAPTGEKYLIGVPSAGI